MKFTCENCGAQYLIADSKLGDRGVKVRCKKCSYVIILRPAGWSPDHKKDVKEEAPASADLEPSYERPPIAARAAHDRDAIADVPPFPTGDLDEVGVAPDMGLSQEFAALGFGDMNELDSSPFSPRHSGGSLDDVPTLGLGAPAGAHASARRESDETDILERRSGRNHLGASVPNIEDDQVGDSTHVDRIEQSNPLSALAAEEDDDTENTPQPSDGGTGEISAALAKVQRNELLEMRSSLEMDMEGLSSALDPRLTKPKDAAPPPAPKPDNHKPDFSALNALASDDDPADPDYNIADEAMAEQEIGSAFEAMFGDASGETVAAFAEPAPPDKSPTRVFDTEAMGKVEAEQAIGRPAAFVEQTPEWYVAIDDQQVGPLTMDEVRERWEAGELAADSLCWKQGLGDWQPIKLTTELRLHLGSMEDRERTVVTSLSEDDSLTGSPVPPQISIHPEPEAREHSMAAAGVGGGIGEAAIDEPSWRPSAASALASLAAEELSSSPVAAKKDDVAVGAALPATSDALEKLLAGDAKSAAATQFGAAEKSESSLRPLPRRAEAITSVPLRDPMVGRPRTGWLMPASILGAALIVTAGVVFVLAGDDEGAAAVPPQTVAMVGATPPGQPKSPPPAAALEERKAPEPTDSKADVKAAEPKAIDEKAAAPEPVSAKSDEKEADDEGEDGEGDREVKKKKSATKKKKERPPRRRERRETVEDRPAPRPRRAPERTDVDDLLEVSSERRRPGERPALDDDTPRQLDDSDILNVLRKHRSAIINCVKKQQAADGSVSGTMMVNMVITKSGQTTRITVTPDRFTRTAAGRCVTSAVKRWRFPRFTGPNMPIDFPVRIR